MPSEDNFHGNHRSTWPQFQYKNKEQWTEIPASGPQVYSFRKAFIDAIGIWQTTTKWFLTDLANQNV